EVGFDDADYVMEVGFFNDSTFGIGDNRHQEWVDHIADDEISPGQATIDSRKAGSSMGESATVLRILKHVIKDLRDAVLASFRESFECLENVGLFGSLAGLRSQIPANEPIGVIVDVLFDRVPAVLI